jgi:hypothetical protein
VPDPVTAFEYYVLYLIGLTPIAALAFRITNTGIHNLCSNLVLGPEDRSLLGKGHKFIPRPFPRKLEEVTEAFHWYERRIRLRFKFGSRGGKNAVDDEKLPTYRLPNPEFQPPPAHEVIEKYLSKSKELLDAACSRLVPARNIPNLRLGERFALSRWMHKEDIVLKPADKNLGLVACDRAWYIDQVMQHLGDKTSFQELSEKEAHVHVSRAVDLIREAASKLDKGTAGFILSKSVNLLPDQVCPHFYLTIKVHKPKPVGRPIVAAHSYVTTPASEFLSKCLERVVWKLDRFIKNSSDVTRALDRLRRSGAIADDPIHLVTGDVESLYPNVDIDLAVKIFRQWSHLITMEEPLRKALHLLLWAVLKYNVVQFDGRYFLQKRGIAMGTPVAPYLASLYMYELETYLEDHPASAGMLYWKRYIDDIFILYRGPPEALSQFLAGYNKLHRRIKVNWVRSTASAEFLDLAVYVRDGLLEYRTHQKVFNRYLYIPRSSFHTKSQLSSWVVGELIRYARTCSRVEDFAIMKEVFRDRLKARGYDAVWIGRTFARFAGYSQVREGSVGGFKKPTPTPTLTNPDAKHAPVTALVLPYNPAFLGLEIKRCLCPYPEYDDAVSRFPDVVGIPTVAWKKEPALANKLIRARFTSCPARERAVRALPDSRNNLESS